MKKKTSLLMPKSEKIQTSRIRCPQGFLQKQTVTTSCPPYLFFRRKIGRQFVARLRDPLSNICIYRGKDKENPFQYISTSWEHEENSNAHLPSSNDA